LQEPHGVTSQGTPFFIALDYSNSGNAVDVAAFKCLICNFMQKDRSWYEAAQMAVLNSEGNMSWRRTQRICAKIVWNRPAATSLCGSKGSALTRDKEGREVCSRTARNVP
jgi:hypothetical protein